MALAKKDFSKEITVTNHALKRYRQRLFDYESSDQRVREILKEIATRGKKMREQPASWDECYEVKYRGITIILLSSNQNHTIVTCLGEDRYRRWVKHHEFLAVFRTGHGSKPFSGQKQLV